jgi:hypothetical protein
MTDTTAKPNRQALAAQGRSLPGKITGRLKAALEFMVWEGASRKQAAERAGLSDHGLRQALRRPHVLAYYRSECEVLRASGRAKRLHRLDELATQDENRNAAVAAIKVAEQLGEEPAAARGGVQLPGLTIQIIGGPAAPSPADRVREIIDVTPSAPQQIDHQPVEPPIERRVITVDEIEGRRGPPEPEPPAPAISREELVHRPSELTNQPPPGEVRYRLPGEEHLLAPRDMKGLNESQPRQQPRGGRLSDRHRARRGE